MLSREILFLGIISLQVLCGFAAQNHHVTPKEIRPEDAVGGLQKLIDSGIMQLEVQITQNDGPELGAGDRQLRGTKGAGKKRAAERAKMIAAKKAKKETRSSKPKGKEGGQKGASRNRKPRQNSQGQTRAGSGNVQQQQKHQGSASTRGGYGPADPYLHVTDDPSWTGPYYATEFADDAYYMDDASYADDYYYDDYYYGAPETKGSKKGKGKKGKEGKGKKGESYDDDYYSMDDYYTDDFAYIEGPYYMDDPYYVDDANYVRDPSMHNPHGNSGTLPPTFISMVDDNPPSVGAPTDFELITISGAFQDARFRAEPVYVDLALEDEFQAGTVYLFVDQPIQDGSVGIDVQPAILGSVQGTCTRTDPNPSDSFEYLGKAICQFNYEFFDNAVLVASFSAQGPVANGFSNILAITGGLGDLEGVSGEVYLEAAIVDLTFSPAMAVADPSLDFLADAEGYLMTAFLYTDPTRANLSR